MQYVCKDYLNFFISYYYYYFYLFVYFFFYFYYLSFIKYIIALVTQRNAENNKNTQKIVFKEIFVHGTWLPSFHYLIRLCRHVMTSSALCDHRYHMHPELKSFRFLMIVHTPSHKYASDLN